MINVTYDRPNYRLRIEGHAGSAPEGQDLVCAATSILAYTLTANLYGRAPDMVRNVEADLQNGLGTISCTPAPGFEATTMLLFDSLCTGFALLEANFPENISFVQEG